MTIIDAQTIRFYVGHIEAEWIEAERQRAADLSPTEFREIPAFIASSVKEARK